MVGVFLEGDQDWEEEPNEYVDIKTTIVNTDENKPYYKYDYIEYFNFYCKKNDQDYIFAYETEPFKGQAATIVQHSTYCTNKDKFWTCEIKSKDCVEGELVGTLGFIFKLDSQHDVIPSENNGVAKRADTKENDQLIYKSMFEYQEDYYESEELPGELNEAECLNVKIEQVPVQPKEDTLFSIMDYKQYIYMTYYCSQGENDVKLIINNDDKKGKVSTLIEDPTDCVYKVGKKEWHCLIKAAGCTEGE